MKAITISDVENFNIKHILECGQIFRYNKINENTYIVHSLDKETTITKTNSSYTILCNDRDENYFVNFFDLKTNYSLIKEKIRTYNNTLFEKAINFGYGIRILKQDPFEMIISFIISANNNIKRIQKSIEFICLNAGKNMGLYYAFPTLIELQDKNEQFFINAGLGYRSKYIVKTIQMLKNINFKELSNCSTSDLKTFLLTLPGIGPKVADCILLFGFSRKNVFPVDTWIKKVYIEDLNGTELRPYKISENLIKQFNNLSGYIQQYLFYYKRSNSK
jgi:N-glycosylase/DNA lyase